MPCDCTETATFSLLTSEQCSPLLPSFGTDVIIQFDFKQNGHSLFYTPSTSSTHLLSLKLVDTVRRFRGDSAELSVM